MPPGPPAIRDAASVILVRRDNGARVLLGQRGSAAAFMPSKFVFPGGAVDPDDGPPDASIRIKNCARRELTEETGLRLHPDAPLHLMFRAITPPARPRRFDARFLLADGVDLLDDPDDFGAACDELSHMAWVPLAQARQLDLPFITEVVLAEAAALIVRSGSAPLTSPQAVPFFDNRNGPPRFDYLRGNPIFTRISKDH